MPACADDPGHGNYKVDANSIGGKVTTWGSTVNGQADGSQGVHAPVHACARTEADPVVHLQPGELLARRRSSSRRRAAFQTYISAHKNDMKGTFRVYGPTDDGNQYVDITGIKVSGDLTIVANGPITADQGSADVSSAPGNTTDRLMVLVSYYAPPQNVACASNGGNPGDCAIGIKNNFQVTDNISTLVYAPNGPVAFKNNAEFFGAVYAGNIVMKNNQVTTYDPAVEQIVGFGPVTLEQRELGRDQPLSRNGGATSFFVRPYPSGAVARSRGHGRQRSSRERCRPAARGPARGARIGPARCGRGRALREPAARRHAPARSASRARCCSSRRWWPCCS